MCTCTRPIKIFITAAVFALAALTSGTVAPAQQVINVRSPVNGQVSLARGIAIAKVEPGYTLWLPGKRPEGMIVFMHPRRDTLQADTLISYAQARNLAVLYVTTDNRLDFLFADDRIQQLEDYIHEAVVAHGIPPERLMYCGMSLAGTRALKLAVHAASGKTRHRMVPAAVAVCDAPLDMLRFHEACLRARELNFDPSAANEGSWVTGYLESGLGGNPQEAREAYIRYSPYTYADGGGPHVHFLKDVALRAYTEPDVHWWIEYRRKDYYGMNALDMAALVNTLKILGNTRAELITTTNRGYLPGGKRHPHSWRIVDERDLVDWFVEVMK